MKLIDLIIKIIKKHVPHEYFVVTGVLIIGVVGYVAVPAAASRQISVIPFLQLPISLTPSTTSALSAITASLIGQQEKPAQDQLPELITGTWQHVNVKPGDTLSSIFNRVGLSDSDLYTVMNSHAEAKVLNRLYPGYKLSFNIPEPGLLQQMTVYKSPLEGFLFTQNEGLYEVEVINKAPEIRPAFKHGSIRDSLFMAGQREEIPPVTIMEMANIFGGVIDFVLDPRLGDDFSILFEEKYLDGEFIGTGEILAAQFTNEGKQYIAVRYQDDEGGVGFYNPQGESMRKAFLRTPLDVFRISSNFSLARRHPILNTTRAHRGTDYAAPTGTPVFATSDGKVTLAARSGSFGKLVIIKHEGDFETKYAHLSEYANGMRKGKSVRQGDVIGYVGSTGSATGPHLHYEFLIRGVHQNPSTVLDKLPKARILASAELPKFQMQTSELLSSFNNLHTARLRTLNQQGAE